MLKHKKNVFITNKNYQLILRILERNTINRNIVLNFTVTDTVLHSDKTKIKSQGHFLFYFAVTKLKNKWHNKNCYKKPAVQFYDQYIGGLAFLYLIENLPITLLY